VLHSVFEEQLRQEAEELEDLLNQGTESFAESLSYFPKVGEYRLGAEDYLDYIKQAKEAVNIPIIASLNGSTLGGWTDYAKKIELAGADAIELNIYAIPTDFEKSAAEIEAGYIAIVKAVQRVVSIPIAVKLAPFFSNLAYLAKKLDEAGANGLVLFNRFYQPDINLDTLEVEPSIVWSTPFAQRLPLRWIAMLSGRLNLNLAATSGIHTTEDAIKAILAGADVVMVCSTLYKNGLKHIRTLNQGIARWLQQNDYTSVEQIRGSLSQRKVADPSAFERAQFVKAITSYPVV
jgi:dihydroorotate dehydrogenase (fumarate)